MAQFLSDAYLAAASETLQEDAAFQSAITNVDLSIQFHVTDAPEGDIDYGLVVGNGSASLVGGEIDDAEVTVTNDYETAKGISTGELNTQMAFMTGKLKVTGNMAALLMHQNVINSFATALSSVEVTY
ncbi:MAG TPA: SCP2 sterol-binding domain-containing protein [Acidimicrobiia bacterium]|nr:SCP2 sterol-binding domain-containing protein [Acidimicrobiia bacterium]